MSTAACSDAACGASCATGTTHCIEHLTAAEEKRFLDLVQSGAAAELRDAKVPAKRWLALRSASTGSINGKARIGDIHAAGAIFEQGCDFSSLVFAGVSEFERTTFGSDTSFASSEFTTPARFTGASFAARASFARAVFHAGADFERSNFGPLADFLQCNFGAVRFNEARFEHGATFSRSRFLSKAVFGRAVFGNAAAFVAVRFDAEASFSSCSFGEKTAFAGTAFAGTAIFSGSSFWGQCSFAGAEFNKEARFIASTFAEKAMFVNATFGGQAVFHTAQFRGRAVFARATFASDANFKEAEFAEVTFRESEFAGRARFPKIVASGPADWTRARFRGTVALTQASFASRVSLLEADAAANFALNGTRVHGDLGLQGVRFGGPVFLDGLVVHGACSLIDAEFVKARDLGPLIVRDEVLLNRTSFRLPVDLVVSAYRVTGRRVRFQAGVNFRLRWADVTLEGAEFGRPSVVTGVSTEFGKEDDLCVRAHGLVDPVPRLVSVQGADVADVALSRLRLDACRFVGAHNLHRLRLDASCHFARSPRFRSRRQVLAEEHEWRKLRRPKSAWFPPECNFPSGWIRVPSVASTAEISDVYRALRRAREEGGDAPGAADFYYGETEMRRHDQVRSSWAERRVLWFYWVLAGYGLRASRSFVVLALLLVGAAAADQAWGFSTHVSVRHVAPYVIGAAVRVNLSAPAPLHEAGRIVRLCLGIAGPVLIALGALALRGRVRR